MRHLLGDAILALVEKSNRKAKARKLGVTVEELDKLEHEEKRKTKRLAKAEKLGMTLEELEQSEKEEAKRVYLTWKKEKEEGK
jgi:hypothetical protein